MKPKKSPAKKPARKSAKKPAAVGGKASPAPVRGESVSLPVGPVYVSGPTDPKKVIEAFESPTHVRFFRYDEAFPFSTIHNGPKGSDNAAKVAEAMRKFTDEGFQVVVKNG